jgi:hypothetical protein
LALVATGFIAFAIGADLTTARATIATQRENLASTTARLDVANARAGDLATEVGTLRAQVQHQQDCVVALRADTAAALRVEDAQTKLHNLYAVGSTFDKAQRARDAALRAAALDYYNAYDAAWDGLYATANSWIDRANSQMSIASRKLETMNAQIDKMNALKIRIEGMLSTAGDALAACGSDGSNAA